MKGADLCTGPCDEFAGSRNNESSALHITTKCRLSRCFEYESLIPSLSLSPLFFVLHSCHYFCFSLSFIPKKNEPIGSNPFLFCILTYSRPKIFLIHGRK